MVIKHETLKQLTEVIELALHNSLAALEEPYMSLSTREIVAHDVAVQVAFHLKLDNDE